jgi:integrase
MSSKFSFIPARVQSTASRGVEVEYYVHDPITGQMIRKRIRVNRLKTKAQNISRAREIALEINEKLSMGWNPLLPQNSTHKYTYLKAALQQFLVGCERNIKEGTIRKDSLRAYKSYVSNIMLYLGEANPYCYQFDKQFIGKFLDHLYHERGNSARTRNNYLSFIHNFCNWMVDKGIMRYNESSGIRTAKEPPKRRVEIDPMTLEAIFDHLIQQPGNYYGLCMTIYLCFIRRAELAQLKVGHFNFNRSILHIPGEFSKNKKNGNVTIPDRLRDILQPIFKDAKLNDYAFSNNHFLPGPEMVTPKKISDQWVKVRKALNLPKEFQFYSLKDTGITKLLMDGIPGVKVRDQARHYDLSVTDKYVRHEVSLGDDELRKI